MAEPTLALMDLLQFIELLDDSGIVQWSWFLDPPGHVLGNASGKHKRFGDLLFHLTGISPVAHPSDPEMSWIPVVDQGPPLQAGVAWNTTEGAPLHIGLSGSVSKSPIKFALTAHLISIGAIKSGSYTPEFVADFGSFGFSGQFPLPAFLKPGTLSGEVDVKTSANDHVDLTIEAQDASLGARTLHIPIASASGDVIGWDCVRLLTFAFEAWAATKAQNTDPGMAKGKDSPFDLLRYHGLPILGEPAGQINPFPIFGVSNMGKAVDAAAISAWSGSVFGAGLISFLMNLRTLVTGNHSPISFPGSTYFPLRFAEPVPENLKVAGAWIAIKDVPPPATLLLELRDKTGAMVVQVPLTQPGGNSALSKLTQVQLNSINSWKADPAWLNLTPPKTPANHLRLFQTTLPADPKGFDGDISFDLVLAANAAVSYQLNLPGSLSLSLPPDNDLKTNVNQVLVPVVNWILQQATDAQFAKFWTPVFTMAEAGLTKATLDPMVAFQAVLGLLPSPMKLGPLTVNVILPKSGLPQLTASVQLGPYDTTAAGLSLHIGTVLGSFAVDFQTGALTSVSISLQDFRLGNLDAGNKQGLIASILPDFSHTPGFTLNVAWKPGGFDLSGGGKVAIQETVGPLSVTGLGLDVSKVALTVGVDLTLKLGGVVVSPYGLGFRLPFPAAKDAHPDVGFQLDGLGLSFDSGGVKLAGMFAKVGGDYEGGAMVSVVDLFQLSAIGAYTKVDNNTSLFIFAALSAPLGGPPFAFLTGFAGGFGYNRHLPPVTLMGDHPFMKLMKDGIDMSNGIASEIQTLCAPFYYDLDHYWVAAGIQFTSFGFIKGYVLVVVEFGNDGSFSLMGMACFALGPIAYFEIDILITADSEKFLLLASISPSSYLISPEVVTLRGSFALGVWHINGDFLLSVGGYHDNFRKPDYYPAMDRVSVKATILGFVHLSVECFFACTPHALMAGASVSLWAEFAGISAGLDVHVDVFIQWSPFFIQARMGICVWFVFLGRHEIGVDLEIHTPPIGGNASISLLIVSFDVSFGDDLGGTPSLSIAEFLTNERQAPATASGNGATVGAFNDADAGLLHLDVLTGRVGKAPTKDTKQEGIDSPIAVNAEFSFAVRTRLPIDEGLTIDPATKDLPELGQAKLFGAVSLPLCNRYDVKPDPKNPAVGCSLSVNAPGLENAGLERIGEFFPAAQFGPALPVAQADDEGARDTVAKIDPKKASVGMTEGIVFNCIWQLPKAVSPNLGPGRQEYSDKVQTYPLPLALAPQQKPPVQKVKNQLNLHQSTGLTLQALNRAVPGGSRSKAALRAAAARILPPMKVATQTTDIPRPESLGRVRGLGLLFLPKGVPPPASPGRRPEMFGINLRLVPFRVSGTAPVARRRMGQRATPVLGALTPPAGTTGAVSQTLTIKSGQALSIDLTDGKLSGGSLAFAGQQSTRAILLGLGDFPLQDVHLSGTQALSVPLAASRVVLLGYGMDAPVAAGPSPQLLENIGVEPDTVLVAIGPRLFAAHGCLVEVRTSIGITPGTFDCLAGMGVLRRATNLRIHVQATSNAACLVFTVEAVRKNPLPAIEQIRWMAIGALLGDVHTVVGPDRTAFVMPIHAAGASTLDIDLGKDWRVSSVVVSTDVSTAMISRLESTVGWDLIDDSITSQAVALSTTIKLDLAQ